MAYPYTPLSFAYMQQVRIIVDTDPPQRGCLVPVINIAIDKKLKAVFF